MLKSFVAGALALAGPLACAQARAETWQTEAGTIAILTVSFDTNYAVRAYIRRDGSDPMSSCAGKFVYSNNTPGENFQAKMAILLNAFNQKQQITFTYSVDSNGYCRFGDISLNS